MVSLTFIVNTSKKNLIEWIERSWHPLYGAVQLAHMRDNHGRGPYGRQETRRLTWHGGVQSEKAPDDSTPFSFSFELLSVDNEHGKRVEVRVAFLYYAELLPWMADLLERMAWRWPELTKTLDYDADRLTFDSKTESNDQALADFRARLERLKGRTREGEAVSERRKRSETNSPRPDFYKNGPRLAIALELSTEARLLVAWLQQKYGNRMAGAWLRPDGSPASLEDMENARLGAARRWDVQPVRLAEETGIKAQLYTLLEIFDADSSAPAEVYTAIRFGARELAPGAAPRCKLSLTASLATAGIVKYLYDLLAGLLADYAPANLVYTPFFAARELPTWLRSEYDKLVTLLQEAGGWQGNPFDQMNRRPPLRLEGKRACGAVFYLDNTTARAAATWLVTSWGRSEKPGDWHWRTDYHLRRKYYVTPLQETTDQRGQVLLTTGIVEWEANHPNPVSVSPWGPLGLPEDQGAVVQDNARGLEILVTPIASDLVHVEARCNALLLLESLTKLLQETKTAYRDRLRLVSPTFGWMETPNGVHPELAEYFGAQLDNFRQLIADMEPAFAIYAPMAEPDTARDDGPAGDDGSKTTPAQLEAARADGPAVKPRRRGRSKPVRQAKIRKLFEEENRRDLTLAQMAKWYAVDRKTIGRDLRELGYILEDGILKDNSPP